MSARLRRFAVLDPLSGHPSRGGLRAAAARARTGPLWLAFPLDAIGLYLVLEGFAIIPPTWPAAGIGVWGAGFGALAFCGLARVIVLRAVRAALLPSPR